MEPIFYLNDTDYAYLVGHQVVAAIEGEKFVFDVADEDELADTLRLILRQYDPSQRSRLAPRVRQFLLQGRVFQRLISTSAS